MQLPLRYYGDPILRKKAAPVTAITPEIREIVQNMIETVDATNGIGLAAPQVGFSLSIIITAYPIELPDGNYQRAPARVFINPKLSSPSKETWEHDEGCLSIPKLYAPVARPVEVVVSAMDLEGNQFTETFREWHARVIMHENDHINGVLFIDRIDPKLRNKFEPTLREIKKNYYKP